eukprot:ctg_1228.g248
MRTASASRFTPQQPDAAGRRHAEDRRFRAGRSVQRRVGHVRDQSHRFAVQYGAGVDTRTGVSEHQSGCVVVWGDPVLVAGGTSAVPAGGFECDDGVDIAMSGGRNGARVAGRAGLYPAYVGAGHGTPRGGRGVNASLLQGCSSCKHRARTTHTGGRWGVGAGVPVFGAERRRYPLPPGIDAGEAPALSVDAAVLLAGARYQVQHRAVGGGGTGQRDGGDHGRGGAGGGGRPRGRLVGGTRWPYRTPSGGVGGLGMRAAGVHTVVPATRQRQFVVYARGV